MHSSGTLVMANIIPPAFFMWTITSESNSAITFFLLTRPEVHLNPWQTTPVSYWSSFYRTYTVHLRLPFTEKQSLIVNGTPRNGVSISRVCSSFSPDWMSWSTLRASSNANSNRLSTTQLIIGLMDLILLMKALTTSSLVNYGVEFKKDLCTISALVTCYLLSSDFES